MAEDWKQKLRSASFRGVPFHVQDSSGDLAGRRSALHEYPGRDDAYSEDMGRKARNFSLTAYVIGADYMAQRDKLIEACAKAGSATLVHPTLGSITALCTGCKVSEGKDGRMATFALTFDEDAGNTQPSAKADTAAAVLTQADVYEKTATNVFVTQYKTEKLPGWASGELADTASKVQKIVGKAGSTDWNHLSATDLASNISSATSELDFVKSSQVATELSEVGTKVTQSELGSKVMSLASDMTNYARRSGLAQAAKKITAIDFSNRNDAINGFKTFDSLIETELAQSSLKGEDNLFFGAQDLRAAVAKDVSTRSANLPALQTVTTKATEPALVAAYRHAGSAKQALDLVARNKEKHPGFISGGTIIEVLEA